MQQLIIWMNIELYAIFLRTEGLLANTSSIIYIFLDNEPTVSDSPEVLNVPN